MFVETKIKNYEFINTKNEQNNYKCKIWKNTNLNRLKTNKINYNNKN